MPSIVRYFALSSSSSKTQYSDGAAGNRNTAVVRSTVALCCNSTPYCMRQNCNLQRMRNLADLATRVRAPAAIDEPVRPFTCPCYGEDDTLRDLKQRLTAREGKLDQNEPRIRRGMNWTPDESDVDCVRDDSSLSASQISRASILHARNHGYLAPPSSSRRNDSRVGPGNEQAVVQCRQPGLAQDVIHGRDAPVSRWCATLSAKPAPRPSRRTTGMMIPDPLVNDSCTNGCTAAATHSERQLQPCELHPIHKAWLHGLTQHFWKTSICPCWQRVSTKTLAGDLQLQPSTSQTMRQTAVILVISSFVSMLNSHQGRIVLYAGQPKASSKTVITEREQAHCSSQYLRPLPSAAGAALPSRRPDA